MMGNAIKCSMCARRFRPKGADAGYWNIELSHGRVTRVLCPDCQTPMQDIEAQVNEAMLDYATDPQGRLIGRLKGGSR